MKKILLLFVVFNLISCKSVEKDDVVSNSNDINDADVVLSSRNFSLSLKTFSDTTYPLVKGNVHTRTAPDGSITQLLDLDSASTVKASSELAKLDKKGLALFEDAGLTEKEVQEIIGDSCKQGDLTKSAILFSAIINDAYPITRGVTGNKYVDCALSALGIDAVASLCNSIKYGVKAAAEAALKAALTGASRTIGATVVAIAFTACMYGF